MKIIVISALVVLMLMMGCFTSGKTSAQSAYAETAYQSGYKHGVADGKAGCSDRCHHYILEPGKGFKFHSWDFNHGYVAGFCSTVGPSISSDADEAGFDCARGPESAFWVGN